MPRAMQLISRLEHDDRLDKLVSAGQRMARLIRPGRIRDGLHGVWLGHPLHPVLVFRDCSFNGVTPETEETPDD